MRNVVVVEVIESQRDPGGPWVIDLDSLPADNGYRKALEAGLTDPEGHTTFEGESPLSGDATPPPPAPTQTKLPCEVMGLLTVYIED